MDYPARSAWKIVVAVSLFLSSILLAEPVDLSQARTAADAFLQTRSIQSGSRHGGISVTSSAGAAAGLTVAGVREIRDDDGTLLAYVTDLEPRGFIVTSANTDIAPVIAYSFRNSFPAGQDTTNPLYHMLREDMKLRTLALAEQPESATTEAEEVWTSYVSAQGGDANDATFQQWPPEGTTATGGWLETTWHQGDPYNRLCPLDPVGRTRSYVGCVATAVAQLVNYHSRCTDDFIDSDAYTAPSGMRMDADSALYDFPGFSELNVYLGAIRAKYSQGLDLNDVDIAALGFACGVAVKMDYSSEGSGAFATDVRDALLGRFGFYSTDMFGGLSGDTYLALQENLINGRPALMSICAPNGHLGHLFVCDGYNTNDEYHLNFGWGSDRPAKVTDVWYHLPTDMLARKNVITEILLNIRPNRPDLEMDPESMSFYAAPGQESAAQNLRLTNNVANVQVTSISCPAGFLIARSDGEFSDRLDAFTMKPIGPGETISVKFRPEQARGYYGTLAVEYGDGRIDYVILKGNAYSGGTQVPAGNVSGTWSLARSPYFVTGNVQVPEKATLAIEPGVKIFFTGAFSMTVGKNAKLLARGTPVFPIEFTAWNKDNGWTGLRFISSGADDVLSCCSITLARKGAGEIPSGESTSGTAQDTRGGAIFCSYSDTTIENCRITNNVGDMAGGIYCTYSYPVISNTLIANNASSGGRPRVGGLYSDDWGLPQLRNCTIVNNAPGGIFATSWEGTNVTNTIVWGNATYQIATDECSPIVSFCDVQGGWQGEGNLDVDPCFFDASDGAGIDYDGSAANWALRTGSPCINSGTLISGLPSSDPAGGTRIYSDLVDIGAYENQSNLPLITLSSSVADAGYVPIDAESTVQLDVRNTGTSNFTIEDVNVADPNGIFSLVTTVRNRVLAPGESVQVGVAFHPRGETSYVGVLDIRSTADNGGHRQVALQGVGVSGAIVPGPSVSGTWKKSASPYVVTGDIRIPKSKTLTIEPGVVVKFAGRFSLTVGYRGTLRAMGTAQDKIVFTATDTKKGWRGIRFVNSAADDTLKYCTIEYANKGAESGGDFYDLYGGAVLCCAAEDDEPGYPLISSPRIDSCLFRHNVARTGGAIMCYAESEAVITNNVIVDNSADIDGAAIALYYSYCTISNNVIARNSAGAVGGGIMNYGGSPSIVNNTIASNRPSGLYLETTTVEGMMFETCEIVNNIIWDNEIFMSEGVGTDEYEILYNDVQGGWRSDGNIDVDPLFADSAGGDYHLKSAAGRWDPVAQAWVTDNVTSLCIDAGDPGSDVRSEPQPNGQRIDMGAYGGTSQASKSPGG